VRGVLPCVRVVRAGRSHGFLSRHRRRRGSRNVLHLRRELDAGGFALLPLAQNEMAVFLEVAPAGLEAKEVEDFLACRYLASRGCHGYIHEENTHALYPYPLWIRAGDAYPKCIMRKRGEDVSIPSDKNCKIISDPYPTYESQDTGIYKIIKLLGPAEFR